MANRGKITTPEGATLIGNGPDMLTRVSMLGNDTQLDGRGTDSEQVMENAAGNSQFHSPKIALDVTANPAADGLIEGRRVEQH
jgi:predicted Zn-dependent protease